MVISQLKEGKITEEKFMQSRRDFENIREINKYIFNTLKQPINYENNATMLNTIQNIESLYFEYLKVLPTNIMDFQQEKLESYLLLFGATLLGLSLYAGEVLFYSYTANKR